MSLLVVGSVALDSIFTPFGETADALGGSAVYLQRRRRRSCTRCRSSGVVGSDYPVHELERLAPRGIDWSGVEQRRGRELPLEGQVLLRPPEPRDAGDPARRVRRLPAQAARRFRGDAEFVFLGNIDPELQLGVLDQVPSGPSSSPATR